MNLYFEKYSQETCNSRSTNKWKEFGMRQLTELYKVLGFTASNDLLTVVTPMAEYLEVPPNTEIIKQGSKLDYLLFLMEGTVKKKIVEDGREQVLSLFDAGNIITNYNAMIYNLDSDSTYITLQKCRFLRFDIGHFSKITESRFLPELSGAFFALMTKSLNFNLKIAKLLLQSNEEKYRQVVAELGNMFDTFSIKNIASLLGMRPETLSRMRSSAQ
jgi:CRP-like cAMP-binding protein